MTTTKTKHTPLPWHIGINPIPSVYGSSGEQIARCDMNTNFDEENLANARLIASAPEMLSMLQEIANSKCDLGQSERRIKLYSIIERAGGDL